MLDLFVEMCVVFYLQSWLFGDGMVNRLRIYFSGQNFRYIISLWWNNWVVLSDSITKWEKWDVCFFKPNGNIFNWSFIEYNFHLKKGIITDFNHRHRGSTLGRFDSFSIPFFLILDGSMLFPEKRQKKECLLIFITFDIQLFFNIVTLL